jgi:hypothetical protein
MRCSKRSTASTSLRSQKPANDRAGFHDRFAAFADTCGHAYSGAMAEQFVPLEDRWLKPDRVTGTEACLFSHHTARGQSAVLLSGSADDHLFAQSSAGFGSPPRRETVDSGRRFVKRKVRRAPRRRRPPHRQTFSRFGRTSCRNSSADRPGHRATGHAALSSGAGGPERRIALFR